MKLIQFLILLLLFSCSPSLDDYREEGESIKRSLIKEFKQIHSRSELIDAKPRLKFLFNELVNTVIAAQDSKMQHPEFEATPITKQSQESEVRLILSNSLGTSPISSPV